MSTAARIIGYVVALIVLVATFSVLPLPVEFIIGPEAQIRFFRPMSLRAQGPSAVRVVPVQAFGAAGNGVTDDTDALVAAIAYGSPAASVVWFSTGTYPITATLQMRSDVALVGESAASTVIEQTDTTLDVIELAAAAGDGVQSFMEIANMTLTHEQATYLNAAGAGISAGDNTASWDATSDVVLRDLILRDIVRQSVKAWKSPTRWTLINVQTFRAGGGGPYFVNGDDINVIGGRTEETGDDGFNFGLSTHNSSIVGHVFRGCGTLAGSPGGQCISTNGTHLVFSGNTMEDYEDAAIEIVESNDGSANPSDIIVADTVIKGAASLDGDSRIMRIADAVGPIRVIGLVADGYNYVTEEDQRGIQIDGTNVGAQITFTNCTLYGVLRGFRVRTVPYLAIRVCEIDAATAGIDIVDGSTINDLRLIDNWWEGAGTPVNFSAFSSGSTVGELFTRGNRNQTTTHFVRIPSGHTITMADMRGDVQENNADLINDIGGSGVTTRVEFGVANAPSAASLGSVSNVVEMFDADGDSIGYVPVYDGFTPP